MVALQRWVRISLFNLFLVSLLGVTMRYKIAFSLPWVEQKHLLHAHSHFAFAGWISQLLMVLIVKHLANFDDRAVKKYQPILIANLITAYGMLLSFPFEGYGPVSITFSTLNIFVSYWFAYRYWKDSLQFKNDPSKTWFRAAVILLVVSSLGAFALAYMTATRTVHQNWYLLAVYFFLHFQYNGWFFFACMGLLMNILPIDVKNRKLIFYLFCAAVVPAYFLSALWVSLSVPVYILIVISALAQTAAFIWLMVLVKRLKGKVVLKAPVKQILILSGTATALKLLLQLLSVIPELSILAFGFRPVVIGYLHLVLLGCISLFLLAMLFQNQFISAKKKVITALIVFIAGIVLNEFVLMLQGLSGFAGIVVPYTNETLLAAAVIMFTGLFFLFLHSKRNSDEVDSNHISIKV